jgi:hypothetical protein
MVGRGVRKVEKSGCNLRKKGFLSSGDGLVPHHILDNDAHNVCCFDTAVRMVKVFHFANRRPVVDLYLRTAVSRRVPSNTLHRPPRPSIPRPERSRSSRSLSVDLGKLRTRSMSASVRRSSNSAN